MTVPTIGEEGPIGLPSPNCLPDRHKERDHRIERGVDYRPKETYGLDSGRQKTVTAP
jgi:hypothetical protein